MSVVVVEEATPIALAAFDTVIDVRSPSEFAEDHVPGALNLPVLSDRERAEVGTAYVQDDRFRARRMGAALVARNIAGHLEGALAGRSGGWRPLLYCWRGGQRSHAMATVLDQVGWRVALLRGGYRTYRQGVAQALYGEGPPWPPRVVLLSGLTGVGKTEVLAALPALGVQVLDLEALANHRGSLFGGLPDRPQPSQKGFESRLHAAMATLDPARPVVVEAESSRVGERTIPPRLWAAMVAAPAVRLHAPLADRVARLVRLYGEGARDPAAFAELLGRVPRHIGRAEIERWRGWLAEGDLAGVAEALIDRHYDPSYRRHSAAAERPLLAEVDAGGGIAAAAHAVARVVTAAELTAM